MAVRDRLDKALKKVACGSIIPFLPTPAPPRATPLDRASSVSIMPIAHLDKCAISKSPKEVAKMTKKPAAKKPVKSAKPAKPAPKKGK
jgi:hypothetical protein